MRIKGKALIEEKIRQIAQVSLKGVRASHGWDHVQRVFHLAQKIGRKEGANLWILKLAALLHDIGRKEETQYRGKLCHARIGAEKATRILAEAGLDAGTNQAVGACIRTHRFRSDDPPVSLEARVLYDADKLDALGAIGVGRAFLFAGEVGARLHNSEVDLKKTVSYSEEDTAYREFQVKLIHIRKRMMTAEGRRLARGRHGAMVRFFKRLEEEIQGLC